MSLESGFLKEPDNHIISTCLAYKSEISVNLNPLIQEVDTMAVASAMALMGFAVDLAATAMVAINFRWLASMYKTF